MRVLSAATLMSLVLPAAAAATPEEGVLSLRASGALTIRGWVNGHGPFCFLLDTGASHSTVAGELAERFGLPVVAKVRVSTSAGAHMRVVVRLDRITIGGASAEGLMPSVVPLAQLRGMEPGIDGVIGQDFLSAFNYTLDYRRKRLRWTAEHDERAARLPLIRAGDRLLVSLPGDGGDAAVLLVPDSGSNAFILFERDGRTAVKADPVDRSVMVAASGPEQAGSGALLREIRVGTVTLRNQPAVILEAGGPRAVEGDGLLPLHRFSSVSFNNRESYLVVER